MRVFVTGLAGTPFAEEGCPDCAEIRERALDLASIPARLRRSTSLHQRIVLDLLARLLPPADRSSVTIVHGSTMAELETAVALASSDEPAPARFTTSVHSSATGIASIAYGNRQGHATLSAGADTLALCLLEAVGRLSEGSSDVVVVVADETSDALPSANARSFGLGLRLSRDPAAGARAIRLEPSESPGQAGRTLEASARALMHALRCTPEESRLAPSHPGHPTIHVEAGDPR